MCLQGGYLLHCGLESAAGGQPALSQSLLAAMEFLLWCLQNLCPFLLQWPWHLQGWFSDVFSFLSLKQVFYPFLSMLSQRCTGVTCGFSLGQQWVCPTQGSFWSLPTEPTPAKTLPWTHTLAVIPEQYASSNIFLMDLMQFLEGIDIKWLLWCVPKSDH